jgi:hypothetical protein
MPAPPPPSVLAARSFWAAVLAALFARAAGRTVYGLDARGHGGALVPDSDATAGFLRSVPGSQGWSVPVGEVVMVCVEGDSRWTRLPEVPSA